MTSDLWAPPPAFVQGQIFSAAMHGNALISAVDLLLGAYLGPEMAYQSGRTIDTWGYGFGEVPGDYRRIFHGWMRNKTNTLLVGVRSQRGITIRVRAGTVTSTTTIAAGAGNVDTLISVDVTSLSGFYEVFVDVRPDSGSVAEAQPLYCYESDPQTYAALAAFSAGAPLAEDWNKLSERAALLWAQQTGGTAIPMPRYEVTSDDQVAEHSTGRYVIRHKHRWLAWQVRVKKGSANNSPVDSGVEEVQDESGYYPLVSYNGNKLGGFGFAVLGARLVPPGETGDTTIAIDNMGYPDYQVIYPNGSYIKVGGEVIKLGTREGQSNRFIGCERNQAGTTANPNGENKSAQVRTWQADEDKDREQTQGYYTWRGVFDLEEYNFDVGTQYEVLVEEAGEGAPDGGFTGHFQLDYLYEVSSTTPTLAGWSAMTAYAYDTTIAANGTTKAVRDNLTWLSASRITYRNHAAPWIGDRAGAEWGGYMVRQKRWLLYYYGGQDTAPELRYFHAHSKEPQTVALTGGKAYTALAYDLEAADGLLPGTAYGIYGVGFAMEDDTQV